jgi:hypothetical protein
MALRLLKEWIRDNGLNARNSYDRFCQFCQKKNQVLSANDFWKGCQEVSVDITEQQSL